MVYDAAGLYEVRMPDSDSLSPQDLFKTWRTGDAQAGQAMAQRFADWYYAIATARLGERLGRQPCRLACERFGQGVGQVNDVRTLVGWAHGIVSEEIARIGEPNNRLEGGNDPSMYTANKPPKALLRQAQMELPAEVGLLAACYHNSASDDELNRLAEPLGGMPLGVLKARYKVKQWLASNHSVPFQVAPAEPNLDRAPLPMYEAGRMASNSEEVNFEHWMLSDLDLCKDIAEFAPFSLALRGGIEAAAAEPATAGSTSPSTEKKAVTPRRILAVAAISAVLAAIAIAIVVAAYFVLS